VEADLNTSSVTLRVEGGDEKGSAWRYNRATLFLGDINTGTWPSRFGRTWNLRQQDIVMSPAGLGPQNECAGKDPQQL
jgi:hypothetical protein